MTVLTVLTDEAGAFAEALRALPEPAWDRPTRCEPWAVRGVVGHVVTALARVPDMVAAEAPGRADTTAITYYRAGERFSEAANTDRVRTARDRAAARPAAQLAGDLAATAGRVVAACERQPAGRIVRTRHGDAMLLSEFLITRVFETAVHGLDVADALQHRPWLTAGAADTALGLLFGVDGPATAAALGWDPATAIRKATGRAPVTAAEAARLAELAVPRLALG